MAKKHKIKKSRIRKPTHCMMVIRAAVPIRKAKTLKAYQVMGMTPDGNIHWLQILNAYYDLKGQPNALNLPR